MMRRHNPFVDARYASGSARDPGRTSLSARLPHAASPHDLPEIIAIPISMGETAYLNWITENTQP